LAARPPTRTPLHGTEFIRRRLADWYVENGVTVPASLDRIAETVFEMLRSGEPVNVWRGHDGTLRARLISRGSLDPNEERLATFRPARKPRR
jgi:hypothetical protein